MNEGMEIIHDVNKILRMNGQSEIDVFEHRLSATFDEFKNGLFQRYNSMPDPEYDRLTRIDSPDRRSYEYEYKSLVKNIASIQTALKMASDELGVVKPFHP